MAEHAADLGANVIAELHIYHAFDPPIDPYALFSPAACPMCTPGAAGMRSLVCKACGPDATVMARYRDAGVRSEPTRPRPLDRYGVKTPLQGMVKSGKNQAYVGYVGYQAVKHWLRTSVFATLSLRSRRHEHLRNAALATLSRASTPLAVIVERQRLDAEESKKDEEKAAKE